jgi:hypothetical protein
VRGTAANHLLDFSPYPFRILHHLIRPEAHHAPTFALHGRRSARIGPDLKSVMIAIDLDHQLSRYAGEVCEVGTNGILPAKLCLSDAARSKEFPDLAFSTAAVAAEFTCSLSVIVVSGHNPLT